MSDRIPAPGPGKPSCSIAAQALCAGPQETSVFGVTGSAARPGERAHIGLKFGRILIYLEDRAALDALVQATHQAEGMADSVYGPVQDVFTEEEARARRRFERSGDATQLK